MKRFHQLTAAQRAKAIKHALVELKSCIKNGLIPAKLVEHGTLEQHARGAAEDAWYAEISDMVIDVITEVEETTLAN